MRKAVFFVCLLLFFIPATAGAVFDPPHNLGSSVHCGGCHGKTLEITGGSPFWTDNTSDAAYNSVCLRCHVTDPAAGASGYGGSSAPVVQSHAPGGSAIKCTVCHDNHEQEQIYPGKYNQGSFFIATGSVYDPVNDVSYDSGTNTTTITYSALTASGSWTDLESLAAKTGAKRGAMLVPDISATANRWPVYMIDSIDTGLGTITIKGELAAASNLGIFYGQLIRNIMRTESGTKFVQFYDRTGAYGFVRNSAPYGICQVCHTTTNHWRNDGMVSIDGTHTTYGGTNCMVCHDHVSELRAECDTCHGYAPGALTGLVQPPDDTGSVTVGAHAAHVNSKGYSCDYCHLDSYGKNPTHNNGDKNITMGFSLFGGVYEGGTYDGQDTAQYNATSTSPVTTVNNTGTKTCSDLYCHGTLPDGSNWGGGTDKTPVWDGAVACGDCHRASAASPPTSGQHAEHAGAFTSGYNYDCGFCHLDPGLDGSLHGNNKSEVIFSNDPKVVGGTYNGNTDMLGSYGSCENLYCHSTIQSSPPGSAPTFRATPAWNGSMGGCDKCHYTWGSNPKLDTGSHDPHFFNDEGQQCYGCHNWEGTDDPCFACHKPDISASRDLHANYEVNVLFSPKYGGSYSGSLAPGDAYGSCSNLYCHGNFVGSGLNATPTWNDPPSAACGTCHNSSGGAHSDHISIHGFDCSLCHYGTAAGTGLAVGTTKHSNYATDWQFDPTDIRTASATYDSSTTGSKSPPSTTYSSCNNLYCHSTVQGKVDPTTEPPVYQNPSWSSTLTGCDDCHKAGAHRDPPYMDTGSHEVHVQYRFTQPGNCQACHYLDKGGLLCTPCHTPHGALLSRLDNHVDGKIDVDFLTDIAGNDAAYNGDDEPATVFNTCDNIYCHSNGKSVASAAMYPVENTTPNWDGLNPDPQADGNTCNNCHPYPPEGDRHDTHVTLRGYTCQMCHYTTTQDSTTISDKTVHVNGAFDLSPSGNVNRSPFPTLEFTYESLPVENGEGGKCSSNNCHTVWGFTDPIRWGYDTISASFSHTETCSQDGSTSTVNVTVTNSGGSGTYECNFDWGDGSSDTWGPCVTFHNYGERDTSTITWQARDDNGLPMGGTNPDTEVINVCNDVPVVDFDLVVGGCATTRDVVLFDRSTDPDFDIPAHSGPGEIKISWDGYYYGSGVYGKTAASANLTDTDPGTTDPDTMRRHKFIYNASGLHDVFIAVKDNGNDWVCSNRKTYEVYNTTSIVHTGTTSVSEGACASLAASTGNYPAHGDIQYQFNANGNEENWINWQHFSSFNASGGVLAATTSGNDPFMLNTCGVDFYGSHNKIIYIRMKTTCGTNGQLFWLREGDTEYSEDRSKLFNLTSDGNFHDYEIDLTGDTDWDGQKIIQLRLDPTNPPNGDPCTVEIDYIQAHTP